MRLVLFKQGLISLLAIERIPNFYPCKKKSKIHNLFVTILLYHLRNFFQIKQLTKRAHFWDSMIIFLANYCLCFFPCIRSTCTNISFNFLMQLTTVNYYYLCEYLFFCFRWKIESKPRVWIFKNIFVFDMLSANSLCFKTSEAFFIYF